MKQITVPGLFRRRNSNKVAAKKKAGGVADGNGAAEEDGRLRLLEPVAERRSPRPVGKVIDIANAHHDSSASHSVSTLTNDRPEATMKTSERLLPNILPAMDDDDRSHNSHGSFESAYSYDGGNMDDVGIGHLSKREQMWYKNQIYLLDKQRLELQKGAPSAIRDSTPNKGVVVTPTRRPRPAAAGGRLASRYESTDRRGLDRYAAGIDRHGEITPDRQAEGISPNYSPKGVEEEFESTADAHRSAKNCDSRREGQFRSANKTDTQNRVRGKEEDARAARSGSSSFPDDEDALTNQSSTLFEIYEDDTRTAVSSSLLGLSLVDGNARDAGTPKSNRSGSLYPHDETFDDVSLGSTTLEETLDETTLGDDATLDITNTESYLTSTSMDDGTTATSYVFELVDKDNEEKKRRRLKKYQIGVGQNAASSTLRRGKVRTTTAMSSSSSASTAPSPRHVAVRSTRSRLSEISVGETTADESRDAFAPEVGCLPRLVEEVSGTYADAASALGQVLHAFFVSEEDVDRVADRVRDAGTELREMYGDYLEERRLVSCAASRFE